MKMTSLVVLLAIMGSSSLNSQAHAAIEWQKDFSHARSMSQKENKPILLFFNGSDWSGLAMKWKHEILDSALFQEKIKDSFVCMEVDFPNHNQLLNEVMTQNNTLKEKFGVEDVPMLVLLDKEERVIAQI